MSGRRPNMVARYIVLLILSAGPAYGLHYAGLIWWLAVPAGLVAGYVLYLFILWRFEPSDPNADPDDPIRRVR